MKNYDILIIGGRISGLLSALYIRKKQPELSIGVVSPKKGNKIPVVGESLTEFSTQLLHELGLSEYLEEEHYHKYGLTFYFKEKNEDSECRNYAVHEALAIPPLPSNQINRFTFDLKLKEMCLEQEIDLISGSATSYEQDSLGYHYVNVNLDSKNSILYTARWLIDSSGRSRFLTKKLGLEQESEFQRSVSWFRLVDFDRDKLFALNAFKPKQQAFDSYFATHHFMGKGNWIWLIPMRTNEHKNMISIGMVWRPDILDIQIKNVDDFIRIVKQEHPVVSELVESGEVIDFERYRNYLYRTKRVYSSKGYYLLGDAANSVDPLYSTGLVMTSIQIKQINELIKLEKEERLTTEAVSEFEDMFLGTFGAVQDDISDYYNYTHEAFQAHWRMHLLSTQYFFFLLPAWLNGYITSRIGVRFILKVQQSCMKAYTDMIALLPEIYKRKKKISLIDIPNRYDKSVNWNLWVANEKQMPGFIAKLNYRYIVFRFTLLFKANFKNLKDNIPHLVQDFIMMTVFTFLRNRKLTKTFLFKKMFKPNTSKETLIKRYAGKNSYEESDKVVSEEMVA